MESFEIEFLDHVAIRVKDMQRSIEWYKKVLGLKATRLEAWGDVPVFMLAGQTGIAIFPADHEDPALSHSSKNIKIDHFAFRVSQEAFQQARHHYEKLEIEYNFQDHHYLHSIYCKDPDGHTVELTTLVVSLNELI